MGRGVSGKTANPPTQTLCSALSHLPEEARETSLTAWGEDGGGGHSGTVLGNPFSSGRHQWVNILEKVFGTWARGICAHVRVQGTPVSKMEVSSNSRPSLPT